MPRQINGRHPKPPKKLTAQSFEGSKTGKPYAIFKGLDLRGVFMKLAFSGLAIFLAMTSVSSAADSTITCSRVGEDKHNGREALIIDGDKGAYSYNAFDGNRETISLKCDTFTTDGEQSAICARVFSRPEGFTTEHYLVKKLADFSTVSISSFIENSDSKSAPHMHSAKIRQFSASCKNGPKS